MLSYFVFIIHFQILLFTYPDVIRIYGACMDWAYPDMYAIGFILLHVDYEMGSFRVPW